MNNTNSLQVSVIPGLSDLLEAYQHVPAVRRTNVLFAESEKQSEN